MAKSLVVWDKELGSQLQLSDVPAGFGAQKKDISKCATEEVSCRAVVPWRPLANLRESQDLVLSLLTAHTQRQGGVW